MTNQGKSLRGEVEGIVETDTHRQTGGYGRKGREGMMNRKIYA